MKTTSERVIGAMLRWSVRFFIAVLIMWFLIWDGKTETVPYAPHGVTDAPYIEVVDGQPHIVCGEIHSIAT